MGHDDFIYTARPRDTLIGLGRRLLREPRRWRDLQRLNRIVNARRIPLNTTIRIPYAWLRMRVQTALAADLSGTVLRDGKPLAAGSTVAQGSRIETGPNGSVTLDLPDGSVVTLQKSSALRLQTLQQVSGERSARDYQLKLEKGRVQTADKPQGQMGRFEIETPAAICAVRGTQFRTAYDPATGAAADETLEGTVAVSGAQAAVSVPADFGTRVKAKEAPIPPVRLLPAPDLAAIPATNLTRRLVLEWPPVAGAVRYRVQLAPDPQFRTILGDTESTSARVSLPAPPDGAFWLRVRALDTLGLEGLDAVKTVTEHLLSAPTPLSPRSGARVTGTRTSFSWSAAAPGARYRWQLARNPNFTGAVIMERIIAGNSEVTIDGMQPGRYVWRIATVGAGGETAEWSTPQSYTQRPNPPILQRPDLARHVIRLRWSGASAAHYHVQLSRDPGFARPLLERDVDAPHLSMTRPRPGTYYARVRSIGSDGT
ncbi:MAG: FecR domain-containing protein, partial [Sciscionella sp.]